MLTMHLKTLTGALMSFQFNLLKAFIKPFEAPHRTVKIKIESFILLQLLKMHWEERVHLKIKATRKYQFVALADLQLMFYD